MHVISIKMLREFWQKHPEAEGVLREWHSVVEHAEFKDFNHAMPLTQHAFGFRMFLPELPEHLDRNHVHE